jgi:hypothetical protein
VSWSGRRVVEDACKVGEVAAHAAHRFAERGCVIILNSLVITSRAGYGAVRAIAGHFVLVVLWVIWKDVASGCLRRTSALMPSNATLLWARTRSCGLRSPRSLAHSAARLLGRSSARPSLPRGTSRCRTQPYRESRCSTAIGRLACGPVCRCGSESRPRVPNCITQPGKAGAPRRDAVLSARRSLGPST